MSGSNGSGKSVPRPYFFLSYAHTPKNHPKDRDPNLWVERFYRDLCDHVLQMTSLPEGVPAGFMDQEMQPGEGWQERLSEALAYCRVFVPLYSPRYFLSEQCGREWFAFSKRAVHHQSRSNSQSVSEIVPALWVPVPLKQLPQPAERLQFNHASFGSDYADEGFYGLIKLRYLREQYERAVYLLAKRIVSVAEETEIEDGDPHQDYLAVPSAFGPPGPARELDLSVLACSRSDLPGDRGPDCYGTHARDWNPYLQESSRPLVEHAADLVRNLDYRVRVGEFDADAARLLAPGPPKAPGLLLLDRWALATPHGRELVRRLSAEDRPWISVMVPWNRDDPEAGPRDDELRAAVDDALAPRVQESSGHRSPGGGPASLKAFSQELPGAVKAAEKHYTAHARTYPPEGPSEPIPHVLPTGIGYGSGVPARPVHGTDHPSIDAEKPEGS
ncbi:TIR-like protein FxsC [Streptomyces purpureus]|uniref:TIR-like protein FxsC n=1 Tax=Streptomyces purpureus TaxID=1951 RepID=UPI0007C74891|nr:TIR-like protein FxsC [Streptomyces purpureus]